jgi:sigma-B regulation protein RsbU (phosphoserine phosphatase)
MSILVVDDTEDFRDIFEGVLAEGGYQDVIVLDSAAAVFSILGIGSPDLPSPTSVDLLFLDVVMPGMNGIEACARIRRDPRYADVPIVITTALDDIESVDKAFKCGATDYLTKPLKVIDLLACVRAKFALNADRVRRNAVEHSLMQHMPFNFDDLAHFSKS